MKKRISSLLLAICLTMGVIPPLTQEASAAEDYEQAWYPAAHMYVVQLAYESYSHLAYNTIDIDNVTGLSKDQTRIFAPFTGVIVYNDTQNKNTKYKNWKNYGYVLLQSLNKVRYADGTVDYMTVGFMHDENISDLPVGKVIKQGEFFYDLGGMGGGDPNAYDDHAEVTVFKGRFCSLSGPSKDGTYTVGNWLRKFNKARKQNTGSLEERRSHGDLYAFDAFFVNTNRTTTTASTAVGYLHKGNKMGGKNAPSDWSGKWKDLNGNPFPALPTISGCSTPSALKTGEKFSVTGTVSSPSKTKLLSVTAGVYTAETGGTKKFEKTANPSDPDRGKNARHASSYDLSKMDSAIQFNKLPAGTYWYRITAKNWGGTVTLVNQKFTVGTPASASAAPPAISNEKFPDTLTAGDSFSIQGTISSGAKLVSVKAAVYAAGNGNRLQFEKTVTPNAASYSLSKLASSLPFNTLPAGSYSLKIEAADASGKTLAAGRSFTVKAKGASTTDSASTAKSTLNINLTNYPSSITAGNIFSLRGKVTSNYSITSVRGYIIDANSNSTVQATTDRPNAKSMDIRSAKLNQSMLFDKLSAGSYYLRIEATDASGETHVWSRSFTVEAKNRPSSDPEKPAASTAPKTAYPNPGWYALTPACAPGMRLDVAYSGASSEDPVWIYGANGTAAQSWYLLPYSTSIGHYLLVAGTSLDVKMVLDVQYGGTESGTPVWLYESNDTPAQEWIFLDAGNGYYYVVPSENQNLTLAVQGGSSAEGSSLVVETRNGSAGQKWKLISA